MRRDKFTTILGTVLLTVLGLILLELVALLVVRSSGWIDVSATGRPSGFERWLFGGLFESGVGRRSTRVSIPEHDPLLLATGLHEYNEMCFPCHSAPGAGETELGKGLHPPPPELWSSGTQKMSDGELLWVVRNGIRRSGMPAFGPTHDNRELQSMVAFVRRLPELKPGEYSQLVHAAGLTVPNEHDGGARGTGGTGAATQPSSPGH